MDMNNIYWRRITRIFLYWSIIFFILLLILEDLKPFLVKTHFTPHWLVPIILVLFFYQVFSHDNYQPALPNEKKLTIFGWIVGIVCWIIIYLYFSNKLLSFISGGCVFILVRQYLAKIKHQVDHLL